METNIVKPNKTAFDFNANIPEKYQKEINKACSLLKNEGVEKVYLFGSMVTGNIHAYSDIDIGIKGFPKGKFIRMYSKLSNNLDVNFDLINFDFNNRLFNLLENLNEIVEIG
jgi:predicted nucleotidyltransferase